MALPQPVITFLNDSARAAGLEPPASTDDLFSSGVLDSFSLVEFLTILESSCGIKVPDSDVTTANFQTVEIIELYLTRHNSESA